MESIIVLMCMALLAVLILPVFFSWNSNSKISNLTNEVNILKKYILELNKTLETLKTKEIISSHVVEGKVEEKPVPIITPKEPEIIIKRMPEETPKPVIIKEEPVKSIEPIQIPNNSVVVPSLEIPKPITPKVPKKKTDFEQFIGEKLISLVGIAILVLGIFFTVKWAVDRNMITDAGKILIGLGAGTILIAVAHKLSKNYRTFSSILAGGGIAVLYFAIYQSYQSYHLLPQAGAFAAMVVITILAIMLALVYDKKELAVIALIGGFSTPFFVSSGSGNYQVLFTYLLILNIGMFVVSNFKKWNLLNIIAYVFTILIFGAWLSKSYDETIGQTKGGLLFATLFYIVFFASVIIYNIRQKQAFKVIEISMLLSNSFLFLGAGLFFLKQIHHGDYQGVFVIALAVFNFAFAYSFYKKQQVDKNLIYLLIGLVLTFISLAGPIQLNGNYITLFWACELVILYWMGVKSGIDIIKNASVAVLVLTLISLVGDWQNNYYSVQVMKLPLLLNKAFITGAVVIVSLIVYLKWIRLDKATSLVWGLLPLTFYKKIIEIITVLIIYSVSFTELKYQSDTMTRYSDFSQMLCWTFHYIFMAALFFYSLKYKSFVEQKIVALVSAVSIVFYAFASLSIKEVRDETLLSGLPSKYIHTHYFLPIAALLLLFLLIRFVVKHFEENNIIYTLGTWFFAVLGLFILSNEAINIWVSNGHQTGFSINSIAAKASKVALPILWSVVSLALMWLGMKKRIKQLRIISLTLFTLTIVKLFAYDISNVSQGGKIAAFIILGIILLIVSFMYQKIKGLFVDEKNENSEN